MSIIEAYDESAPIVGPHNFYNKIETLCDVCIATFKDSVRDKVLEKYDCKEVFALSSANGKIPVYYLKDQKVLFYMSPIGSACAGSAMQEVAYISGVKKFIFFGSCGVLDGGAEDKIIVPNSAYRDEGLSYHYCAPADFIDVKNHDTVERVLEDMGIDFAAGKTWTTDAFFMETKNKVANRREQGCVCVEMECAGLQAVGDYLGVELYVFFFVGDLLFEKWSRGNLGGESERARQADCFDIALSLAECVKLL